MPTYLNSGTTVVDVGGLRIEPGEALQTNVWIDSLALPANVTQTSVLPYFDPILYSARISGDTVVTVPSTITGNYRVRIEGLITGSLNSSATVNFNNLDSNDLVMGPYTVFTVDCSSRTINEIMFTSVTGIFLVIITKI